MKEYTLMVKFGLQINWNNQIYNKLHNKPSIFMKCMFQEKEMWHKRRKNEKKKVPFSAVFNWF